MRSSGCLNALSFGGSVARYVFNFVRFLAFAESLVGRMLLIPRAFLKRLI